MKRLQSAGSAARGIPGAGKLCRRGNVWSRLDEHHIKGGCWYLHPWVPLAWGLLHRGCGGWYGIAVAVAGMVPALQPYRLQYLTRDKLKQKPPERIKNGNVRVKFGGNKDMDLNPCWLLPRDRQGRQQLCQGPTRGLAPPAPAALACACADGEARLESLKSCMAGSILHWDCWPWTSCCFDLQLQKQILQELPIAQLCCHVELGVMARITLGASPCANHRLAPTGDWDAGLRTPAHGPCTQSSLTAGSDTGCTLATFGR